MVVQVMRIITGIAKGRRLVGPKGFETRPMQDRVKEAVFSSIGAIVEDARVLDLYAGTGSLGLESLSRGAASATFVESSRDTTVVLKQNVTAIDLGGTIVTDTVERFIGRSHDVFDLVFCDPPYPLESVKVAEVLASIVPRISEGATVILHRKRGEDAPEIDGLELVDERRYGTTQIWRYEKETGS